ncbi:CCE_0567 family metalloprotein [Rhizobium sullae]|nr:CCE_0567 family metalloprotein [Rhizobium sullae]UWU19118.1 CCE_0567 family metalloprotein [Rhizobium sullae]
MSELQELKKRVWKLEVRAWYAKMELHDLAEEFPVNWTEITAVAEKTFHAFAELDAAKRELAASQDSK